MKENFRKYNRGECIVFRKTHEEYGGLSNMAAGYAVKVNGIYIRTSEALYQCCRFPHLSEVQKLIIAENSPMTAKMVSKKYKNQTRDDWNDIRVNVMRWALRVKLLCNVEKFGRLLIRTGDKYIVEESLKDDFWGAKPQEDGTLIGENALGRLLMELREQYKHINSGIVVLRPVKVEEFKLLDNDINIIKGIIKDEFKSVKKIGYELSEKDVNLFNYKGV